MPARVILGVSAGIAAYKACELLRRLTETGHQVRVVPTADSLHFVGAATWAALSGQPVTTTPWEGVHEVPHVGLGQQADLVFVAPATADLLARAATGRADDLLDVVDSKYRLVIMAAKRARQINAYYAQLGEGLLEYVGPLVETRVQEKPLSIALREIREGLLSAVETAEP